MGKLLGHILGPKYLSWIYLEQGLNIYKDSFTHCCVPHSNGKGCVDIGKFHGDEMPMKLIMDARRRLIDDNQTQNDTPCSGCRFLTKKRWHTKYPLRHVNINDFYACNLRCQYCFTLFAEEHLKLKKTHDTFLLFQDIIKNRYLSPAAVIYWGGGEVAVYKHFKPTARLMLDNNVTQFVNTNAVKYSEIIEEGLRQNKIVVQISVDFGTRETYKTVKGKDAFEDVWRNLARYSSAGDVQVKYIIKNNNSGEKDVKNFIGLCRKTGISEIIVMPEMGELTRKAISDETISAVALMIYEAIKSKIVVDEQVTEFGKMYAARIKKELSLLLQSDQKNMRIIEVQRFGRKLRRYIKHNLRDTKTAMLAWKNRIKWQFSPKASAG